MLTRGEPFPTCCVTWGLGAAFLLGASIWEGEGGRGCSASVEIRVTGCFLMNNILFSPEIRFGRER